MPGEWTTEDVNAGVREATRLGIKVDMFVSKWRNRFPKFAIDGVLSRDSQGLSLSLNGDAPVAAQAWVLRQAIKELDREPGGPGWDPGSAPDSWIRPLVAPGVTARCPRLAWTAGRSIRSWVEAAAGG